MDVDMIGSVDLEEFVSRIIKNNPNNQNKNK
jgi:hypothetical protein